MERFIVDLDSMMEQLDGTLVTDERQKPMKKAMILASQLMQAKVQDNLIVKYYSWAMELKKSGQLMLDKSDKEELLTFIDKAGLVVLFAAPIKEAIQNARIEKINNENLKKVK